MLPRVERPITHFPRLRSAHKFLAVAALACGLTSFLSGCGPSVGGYCNEAKNCEGGNDFDEESCNIRFDEYAALSDNSNCAAEFDEWFACLEERSRCNDDRYRVDHDEGECGSEREQLQDCADIDLHGAQ